MQFNNEHRRADASRQHAARSPASSCSELLSRHDVETAPRRATRPTASSSPPAIRCALPADDSFFVQDEASQLVPLVVDAQPGERMLDLCASPGGKTVAMAAGHERLRHARRLRRAERAASACCATPSAAAARGTCIIVQVPPHGPLPFADDVRSRARGRAVLGPRHHPPRSGHPLAAHRERSAASRRAAGRPARRARPRRSGRAAGWCTPPARASPRRTSGVVDAFLERAPFDRARSSRTESPRCLAAAARRPRRAAHAALRTRPRGVLRRRAGSPGTVSPLVVRSRHQMRLGTRVWSVGKFFLLVGALGATFLLFFADLDAGGAAGARGRGAGARRPHRQRGNRDAGRDSASACASTTTAAPIAKVPLGRVMQQDPGAGMRARRQRTIRVWVSSGPRVDDGPRAGRTDRAHRADAPRSGRPPDRHALGDSARPTTPPTPSSPQDPPPAARAPDVSMLAQSRRTGHDLRDAGSHRHGRRTRGRSHAQPRLSRDASSARSRARHAARHHRPAAAGRRIQGGARPMPSRSR